MRKLTHSKFELDLSPFKLSDTEENNWFSDSFFTKYSFPFDIDLTEDLDIALEFISLYNTNPETYFEVKYVHNNRIEDAIFEIESHDEKLTCMVRFGFEQLPSFDKKLSELSLDKFNLTVGTTIFEHAETIITQKWPAVNYNFPQIHVDKYDPTDALWNGFEKIINNRVAGAFLENTVDIVEDITYNRNVMQPLPYWIYILERGIIDSGYTLAGKILTDERLKKACLFGDVDYFSKPTTQEPIYINQMSEDAIDINYNNSNSTKAQKYYFHTVLTTPGKYNITGTVKAMRRSNFNAYFFIKYRDRILYSVYASDTSTFHGSTLRSYDINIDFETIVDLNVNDITIENYQAFTTNELIIDLNISLTRLNDITGVAIPTIINENKIDLTRAVPNITFGEFIKVLKNWFNYDLTIVGKLAIMNPIDFEINYKDAVDYQFSEVKKPTRKFYQGISFLLKFSDVESTEFKFLPVYHDRDSVLNSNYTTDEKTISIEITALPLPLLTRNNVQTAYALEQNDSKVFLVNYDGIHYSNNLAQSSEEYLLPAVHSVYWVNWFNYRINSHGFIWTFKAWNESILTLKAKMKIFAYKKVHIIKTINKTELAPNLYEIEIETEGLK